MTAGKWVIITAVGVIAWAMIIGCTRAALADDPLDKWRAYADIGAPTIHHLFDVAPCPGTLACTTVAIDSDGRFEGWVIIGTDADDWIYIHEYGHALGLALDGHTSGIMGTYGGDFDQSNVDELREIYPRYEFRLVVNY